ncbi:hypothetical protein ACLB1O_09355 [Escherichia coli]
MAVRAKRPGRLKTSFRELDRVFSPAGVTGRDATGGAQVKSSRATFQWYCQNMAAI